MSWLGRLSDLTSPLRVRYADAFTGTAGGSAAAGEEALSPFKIAEGYSGNANGKADPTASKEGVAGNRLSIQILKQTVEAKTRKLSARWTFESAQDAQSQHGIDVEAEIMAAWPSKGSTHRDIGNEEEITVKGHQLGIGH